MKSPTRISVSQAPWRLMFATAVVAFGASLSQVAWARPGGGPGEHGGPPMEHREAGMSHRHMARMLDKVNATAEQRAQIQQITQGAHAEMAGQRDAGRHLHQQMNEAFAQPNVDANTVEALRQQMLAQHDQASKRMMQMRLDISRVLTPEQRAQIKDSMDRRMTMMKRHRAEREALQKPTR